VSKTPIEQELVFNFCVGPLATIKSQLLQELGLTKWQYQKLMEKLKRNRWIITICHNVNQLNPFFRLLLGASNKWVYLAKYATNHDFLDLFSIPFYLAKKEKPVDLYIHFEKYPIFKAYFDGLAFFQIQTQKSFHYTVLPINIHYSGANPHITLPMKHDIFELETCGKRKIKEIWIEGNRLWVHFDNSISLSLMFKSASWLNWRTPNLILRQIRKFSRILAKELEKSGTIENKLNEITMKPMKQFYRMYKADYEFLKRYWDGHDYIEFNEEKAFETCLKQALGLT